MIKHDRVLLRQGAALADAGLLLGGETANSHLPATIAGAAVPTAPHSHVRVGRHGAAFRPPGRLSGPPLAETFPHAVPAALSALGSPQIRATR
jgi:hypothetical protein